MLALIVKDFKLLFANKNSLKKNIVSAFMSVLAWAIVIAIEIFVFTMLLRKLQGYDQATLPFLTLFLFIISIVMIFLNIFRANRLFFDRQDTEQLIRRPVSSFQIVSSKLVFLFITHYLTTALLVYPLIIAYGRIIGRTVMYYYQGLFYPVLSFFFEAGIALILVYPFRAIVEYLKKHIVLQFGLALVVMAGACFVYSNALDIFMELVVNNEVASLFTKDSIAKLIALRRYLIPVTFMTDIFFVMKVSSRLFPCICISIGLFILGTTIVVYAFAYFRSAKVFSGKKKARKVKIRKVKFALLKKEMILLFKDSGNIFSFTGLLMIQPLLVYSIVHSLNLVFSSGAFSYYMILLPELLPLIDVLLVMLFTLIINQGANEYIQAEKQNVRVMKTIPVSASMQLMVKMLVPFGLSFASLLFTVLVLLVTGTISFTTFLFSFLLTSVLLFVFDVISLKEELAIRNSKPRSTLLSTIYSYLLPLAYFVVAIYSCYLGMDIVLAYLIGFVFLLLIGLPHVFGFKKKITAKFLDLEMVN